MSDRNEFDMFYGATPEIFQKAKELRYRLTEAESMLWNALADKKLDGYKFRRQHPLYFFIADFYCHQKKLVIELDGKNHVTLDQGIYDIERTDQLAQFGIRVIRFSNQDVLNNFNNVLEKIREALNVEIQISGK